MKILGVATAIVTLAVSSSAIAGEISGRQFLVLGQGPTPAADNSIFFVPCSPTSNDCEALVSKYLSLVNQYNLDIDDRFVRHDQCTKAAGSSIKKLKKCSSILTEINYPDGWKGHERTAEEILAQADGLESVRTGYEGEFSFNCPAQSCLLYSFGRVGRARAAWMMVVGAGNTVNLTGSNVIDAWNSR